MKKAKASASASASSSLNLSVSLPLSLSLCVSLSFALAGLPHTQWLHRFIAVTSDDDSRFSVLRSRFTSVRSARFTFRSQFEPSLWVVRPGTRLGLCALVLVLVLVFFRATRATCAAFLWWYCFALFFAHSRLELGLELELELGIVFVFIFISRWVRAVRGLSHVQAASPRSLSLLYVRCLPLFSLPFCLASAGRNALSWKRTRDALRDLILGCILWFVVIITGTASLRSVLGTGPTRGLSSGLSSGLFRGFSPSDTLNVASARCCHLIQCNTISCQARRNALPSRPLSTLSKHSASSYHIHHKNSYLMWSRLWYSFIYTMWMKRSVWESRSPKRFGLRRKS